MCDVEVTFTNGEVIRCHENHVWRFYDRTKGREVEAEIKHFENARLEEGTPNKRGHRYNLQLPKHDYVIGEKKDLPLDPYVLGVWLGDGTTTNPTITSPKCDKAIIDRIVERGYPISWESEHKTTGVMSYGFGFRNILRSMGMCHSRKTFPKYIPEEYLTASVEQRLDLLAGLIDTDGCKKYDGRYTFSTTSEEIRQGVCDLISTFGWRYTVSEYEPKVSSSGVVGRKTNYVISFNVDCTIPCALERKRNTRCIDQKRIAVKSITRIKAVQGNCITVEGDGMYLAGRTMLPTHNSALALFFLTWWGGHIPNRSILTISHNHVFVKSAYEEIKKIIGRDSEYRYHDVFPEATIKYTDALGLTIALDKTARFPTFMFGSLGSGLAGRVRAESLLFCDDLIPGIEVALSEDQLQKTWQSYTGDLLQRKISGAVELHIATRWSVRDVIGRLKMKYEDDPRAKFIEVPAMNEEGKSNFDYPFGLGYSTKALERLRSDMDEASFQALYMNEPIEREGQLYAPEDLRRYFELPDKEPDAIVSICDTKEKGEDYAFLPVAYIYGNDVYIEDCICNDGKPEVVELLLANKLMQHKVQIAQFESNSAGGKIAESIQAVIKQQGGNTKITTKRTTANKETKIYANAPYVKEHFLFKDTSVIGNNREYRRMMQFLTSYSMKGKNKHDDVPDGMAMLALFLQNMMFHNVEVFTRPF
jgi:predicted phage terminase large subunit-like protein